MSADLRGLELAQLIHELQREKAAKAEATKEFGTRIAELELRIAQLAEEIETGQGRLFESK